MPKYECVRGNWPRRNPHPKGKIIELSEAEAKYAVIDGDLVLHAPKEPAKPKAAPEKATPEKADK